MEKKYIIVRLDDNNYWGFGYWESDVKLAQFFNEPNYPAKRIMEGDLIEKEVSLNEMSLQGKVFEVREIFVNKK